MNILYIGPNQSEWADANCPGSLAAARWSRGLLKSLSKICDVTALTDSKYLNINATSGFDSFFIFLAESEYSLSWQVAREGVYVLWQNVNVVEQLALDLCHAAEVVIYQWIELV